MLPPSFNYTPLRYHREFHPFSARHTRFATMAPTNPGEWKVDVMFTGRGGTLVANASGLLLVPPEHALAYVTDPGAESELQS